MVEGARPAVVEGRILQPSRPSRGAHERSCGERTPSRLRVTRKAAWGRPVRGADETLRSGAAIGKLARGADARITTVRAAVSAAAYTW